MVVFFAPVKTVMLFYSFINQIGGTSSNAFISTEKPRYSGRHERGVLTDLPEYEHYHLFNPNNSARIVHLAKDFIFIDTVDIVRGNRKNSGPEAFG
jgi:hypothetical protein